LIPLALSWVGKGEALVSFLEGGGTPTSRARRSAADGADRADHAEARASEQEPVRENPPRSTPDRLELQKRVAERRRLLIGKMVAAAAADSRTIGSIVGTIFGTNVKRGGCRPAK
jgi:hypothetical protein